jgi:hypothetical protein
MVSLMHPARGLLLMAILLPSCSRGVPTGASAWPSPGARVPTLTTVFLCCGSNQVQWKTQRQIQGSAIYSDGSRKDITPSMKSWTSSNPDVAPISGTGVVTGLKPGNFVVSASYAGREVTWAMYVAQSPFRSPEANEVTGYVREVTSDGSVELWPVEVEVVGGPSDGLKVQTGTLSGHFRVSGLQAPGFELVLRRRGYTSARVYVSELGRELNINLTTAPGILHDRIEGEVCNPTRTISRSFTAVESGFMRITRSLVQHTTRALYVGSVLIQQDIGNNQDIELEAGVTYELRLTGRCGETLTPRGGIIMLRPPITDDPR